MSDSNTWVGQRQQYLAGERRLPTSPTQVCDYIDVTKVRSIKQEHVERDVAAVEIRENQHPTNIKSPDKMVCPLCKAQGPPALFFGRFCSLKCVKENQTMKANSKKPVNPTVEVTRLPEQELSSANAAVNSPISVDVNGLPHCSTKKVHSKSRSSQTAEILTNEAERGDLTAKKKCGAKRSYATSSNNLNVDCDVGDEEQLPQSSREIVMEVVREVRKRNSGILGGSPSKKRKKTGDETSEKSGENIANVEISQEIGETSTPEPVTMENASPSAYFSDSSEYLDVQYDSDNLADEAQDEPYDPVHTNIADSPNPENMSELGNESANFNDPSTSQQNSLGSDDSLPRFPYLQGSKLYKLACAEYRSKVKLNNVQKKLFKFQLKKAKLEFKMLKEKHRKLRRTRKKRAKRKSKVKSEEKPAENPIPVEILSDTD